MNYYKWLDKNAKSLKGKNVVISGSTGGIGQELCDYLAYLGANIVCLDRSADKYTKLINNLKAKYPDLSSRYIPVDLEYINLVKEVTEELKQIEIDYLILNAGAYKIPRHKCSTGFDNVYQINFLSPYYISRGLFSKIKSREGRVVAVSSIAHNYSKIDVNDTDFSTRSAESRVYGNAKRFLTFSLLEYFKNDNTISIVHPGISFTNITNHYPKFVFSLIKYPMKFIFMKPKKAALSIIYGLFNGCNSNEWIGPRFFNVWGLPKKQKLNTCDVQEAKLISNISENIFYNLKEKR